MKLVDSWPWPVLALLVCGTYGFRGTQARAQQPSPNRDQAVHDDTYAVYSAVLAKPTYIRAEDNEKYLIGDKTGSPWTLMQNPRGCVSFPSGYSKDFDEILADYDRHKNDQVRLEPALAISKPYELLSKEDVAEFFSSRFIVDRKKPSPRNEERFRGGHDLIWLGNVYFNRSRTLALVEMRATCRGNCGGQTWRVFEKSKDGRWEDKPWVTCFTYS